MRVSIVVPVNDPVEARRAVTRVCASAAVDDAELVLVAHNDLGAAELEGASTLPLVVVRDERPAGAAGRNAAAAAARGELIAFVDPAGEPDDGWLGALLEVLERRPTVGAAGGAILRADGRLEQAGGIVLADGSAWAYGRGEDAGDPRFTFVREVDYCSSALLLVRADALAAAGGFDPAYGSGAYADVELGFALREAGFVVCFTPSARLVRHEDPAGFVDDPGQRGGVELSVVVPTRDRADLLRRSLASLADQTVERDRYEVVVVDDGSADDTVTACSELADRIDLRCVSIESSGIAAAKNVGVRAARGAIVLFFDDDDVADPTLLAEHLRIHAANPGEEIAVLGATTWDDSLTVSPLMHFVTDVGHYLFSYHDLTDGQELDYTYFWGGRSSCKRALLQRHGLFNPEFVFGSEDIELGLRLSRSGLKVIYAAGAVSRMIRPVTFEQFCTRCERQGRSQWWFSRLHDQPEVRRWCGVADAERRYATVAPSLPGWMRRVHELEGQLALVGDADQREPLLDELHGLYWKTFDALKLKGIVEAMAADAGLDGDATASVERARIDEPESAARLRERRPSDLARQAPAEPSLLRRASNRASGRRILVCDPLMADCTRASGSRRLFEMLRLMAGEGHAVTFVARDGADGEHVADELRALGVEVFSADPDRLRAWSGKAVSYPQVDLPALLATTGYDIAILSYWYLAEQYLPLVRRFSPRTRIVVDTVDLHYLRHERHAALTGDAHVLREAIETKGRELAAYRQADALVTVTEPDRDCLLAELPDATVYVVPNIHDPLEDVPGPAGREGLVFVGNYLHRPNPDAVHYLLERVMPHVWAELPQLSVTLLGYGMPEEIESLASDRVIVDGHVPDVVPYLQTRRLSVAPLRFGAGIKGKVCEAMAAGIPVVTTAIGAEGMRTARDDGALAVADEPERFAAELIRLCRDDDAWARQSQAGRAYVDEHLSSSTVSASLLSLVDEEARAATTAGLTSIVVLARDQLELTRACLESVAARTAEPYELIVVDNGSTDGTGAYLRQLAAVDERVTVIANAGNRGFGPGNNQGLAVARGSTICFLNNDTVVTDGWLGRMRCALDRHPDVGLVGPVTNRISGPQLIADPGYGTVEELPAFAAAWAVAHAGETVPIERPVGFCLLVRHAVIEAIGGFDERFATGNLEDDDLSVRAAAEGYRAVIARDAFVHHVGSQTFKGAGLDYQEILRRNWSLFREKWGVPATVELGQEHEIGPDALDRVCRYEPLPALGLTHDRDGRVWHETGVHRVLSGASRSIARGRAEGIRAAFAEARGWNDVHRRYQVRRELVERALQAPREGSAWMGLFLATAEELLADLLEEPCEPVLLNYAGVLLYELGEYGGAEALFRAAARLDATVGPIRDNLDAVRRRKRSGSPAWVRGPVAVTLRALAGTARKVAGAARVPSGMTLTLAMIVKDEEEMLPGCLAAVRGVVDEIVVVDTGSSDRTVEIAESFGARVVRFAWTGSFAEARNVSLEHAKGDWVMYLDADEHLVVEDAPKLRGLLGRTWREAFYLVETNYTDRDDTGSAAAHLALRVFRNRPEYRFEGRIHEQKTQSMPTYLPERFESTTIRVRHYGYLKDRMAAREKSQRNIELLRQEAADAPGPFTSFNLGSEYLALGDPGTALEHLGPAWEALRAQPGWQELGYAPLAVVRLVAARRQAGDRVGARRIIAEALATFPDHTDLVMEAALCLREDGAIGQAIELVERCLEMGDAPARYAPTVGNGTYLALGLLAELRAAQGRWDEAEALYRRSLRDHPEYVAPALPLAAGLLARGATPDDVAAAVPQRGASAQLLLATACYEAGQVEAAEAWFRGVLARQPGNPVARLGVIESLLSQRRYRDAHEAALSEPQESPLLAQAIVAQLFAAAATGDRPALASALSRGQAESLADGELAFFAAWGAGPTDALPASSLPVGATVLEALLRAGDVDAFPAALAAYERIDIAPRLRRELLAQIFLRRGYLDSAADEWIAVASEQPDAAALIGLAQVALARDLPDDALVFAEEAVVLAPDDADALRVRDSIAGRCAIAA